MLVGNGLDLDTLTEDETWLYDGSDINAYIGWTFVKGGYPIISLWDVAPINGPTYRPVCLN